MRFLIIKESNKPKFALLKDNDVLVLVTALESLNNSNTRGR